MRRRVETVRPHDLCARDVLIVDVFIKEKKSH